MNTDVVVIRPKKVFSLNDLKEVWQYRELLYFFTWRDLKVRYKQATIGFLWAVFQPMTTMIIFSVFFGYLLKIPSDGVPYPVFVYSGLLFWQFFSTSLSEISNILIANQAIITKVYFPRLTLPLSTIVTNFIDFCIASLVLIGMMAFFHRLPGAESLLIVPLLLCITFMFTLGSGLFLAAVNVKYRDVRFILPFFLQLLLFITPVIYPASVAGKYSWILAINPMTGVIQNARAVLLGTAPVNFTLIGISFVVCSVILVIGVVYFKKIERYFADLV
jgi:lipopolysaccharide transport system permease protein